MEKKKLTRRRVAVFTPTSNDWIPHAAVRHNTHTHTHKTLRVPFSFLLSHTQNQKISSHDQIVEFKKTLCGIVHFKLKKKKICRRQRRRSTRLKDDYRRNVWRISCLLFSLCVCVEITKENWSREREREEKNTQESLSLGGVYIDKRGVRGC